MLYNWRQQQLHEKYSKKCFLDVADDPSIFYLVMSGAVWQKCIARASVKQDGCRSTMPNIVSLAKTDGLCMMDHGELASLHIESVLYYIPTNIQTVLLCSLLLCLYHQLLLDFCDLNSVFHSCCNDTWLTRKSSHCINSWDPNSAECANVS